VHIPVACESELACSKTPWIKYYAAFLLDTKVLASLLLFSRGKCFCILSLRIISVKGKSDLHLFKGLALRVENEAPKVKNQDKYKI
jgi:hypothetical protein